MFSNILSHSVAILLILLKLPFRAEVLNFNKMTFAFMDFGFVLYLETYHKIQGLQNFLLCFLLEVLWYCGLYLDLQYIFG